MKNKSVIILLCCAAGFFLANVPGALIGAGIGLYCIEHNLF